MSKTKLALDVVENLRALAESIEAVVNAAVDNAPSTTADMPITTPTTTDASTATDTPPEKAITLVELRAFVAERSTPENRPKIKEMLTRYGVKKLTELTEDKFSAVMREVAAL